MLTHFVSCPVCPQLRQFEVSYDGCGPIESDNTTITGQNYSSCEEYLRDISVVPNFERLDHFDCHCTIDFTLPEDIRPPWNFYYGMRNYYQNHRRYLNSWDVEQLRGNNFRSPTSDCRPFVRINANQSGVVRSLPVVPCGLVANSWFNGMYALYLCFFGGILVFIYLSGWVVESETVLSCIGSVPPWVYPGTAHPEGE